MKKIHISYFASLREERGLAQETLQTTAKTALDLYKELCRRHSFSLPSDIVRVAVNDAFHSLAVRLRNNDKVIFVPPVAGG